MAVLQFDQAFDLRQVRAGKLVGGRFEGELQIRGRVSRDGDPEELFVQTRDVQLRNDRIITSQPVEFRLGKNRGRGRDLTIRLRPDDSGKKEGLKYGGIESFQLAREVQLRVELPPQKKASSASIAGLPPTADGAQPPIEVTCQGLFRFDATNLTASFEDHVDVVRLNPNGPGDTLAAELLTLQFGRKNEYGPASQTPDPNRFSQMEVRTVSAKGNPVVVRSAQNEGAEVRCQTLTYDVPAGKLTLQDQNRVTLRRGQTEIQVPQLEWTSSGAAGIGLVSAVGPGSARMGSDPAKPDQNFDLQWTRQLRIEPDGRWQRVLIQGQATASNGPLSRLSSDEIWLWLEQSAKDAQPQSEAATPPAPGLMPAQVRPDHLVALGHVGIEHPMLSGRTERLEVWFDNPAAPPVARTGLRSPAMRVAGRRSSSRQVESIRRVVHRPSEDEFAESAGVHPAVAELPEESSFPADPNAGPTTPPARKFDVEGKLIRLRMVNVDNRPKLSDVAIEGAARFAEVRTAEPNEKPLLATGDALFVAQAHVEGAHRVKVVGQPGHIEARGLALEGATIELDSGQNRLWMNGPGKLELPLERDLEGRPAEMPDVLSINWHGRMDFDGLTFYCDQMVVARTRAQQLHSGVLEVAMNRRLLFGAQLTEQRPEPEQLSCRLGVFAESRSDGPEGLTSIERMKAQEMSFHRGTGAVQIVGPGWLTSVRRGAPSASLMPAGNPGAPAPPPGDELSYLKVEYQRQAAGDWHRRQLTFTDNVVSTYGPVPNWDATIDPDRTEGLGPRDYQLKCNELTVIDATRSGLPSSERGNLELVANDNTYIDGQKFRAWASRLTFTQAKDLIVLEGNGRSDARLWHEPRPGAPHTETAARHIQFSPSTQQLQVTGIRGVDVQVPQNTRRPEARPRGDLLRTPNTTVDPRALRRNSPPRH
jgi:lipopolysaccharide export system protein LptA